MAQWIVFSVAVLLTSNAVADILVQPGYGQPHSVVQSHSMMHPIAHPLSAVQRATEKEDIQQQQESLDPGYHYELHPVYAGLHQAPGDAPYSLVQPHQLTPYLSRAAQRRLNSGKLGNFGLGLPVGLPAAVAPQYHPLAVHSRHRRSSGDKSSAGSEREKRDKIDVATKSSLNENVSPVVDLQSQDGEATKGLDEKHLEVRQSKNGETSTAGILLGLNPSNMYPVNPQYRSIVTAPPNPAFISHQQIIGEQARTPTLSQVYSRATTQEQTPLQNQAATSTQTASLRVNLPNMQYAMLHQQPVPLQRQQHGILQNSVDQEQRNFPDPRPVPSAPQSPSIETSNDRSGSQTSTNAKYAEMDNDRELVGAKLKSQKVLVHQHGGTFMAPSYASSGSYGCPCTNPGYMIYNDVTSNNLALADARPQQAIQIYQVPSVQDTIYSSNANYVVPPQAYSNYPTNYGLGYPSSASPVRFCLENLDSTPSVMYQLVRG